MSGRLQNVADWLDHRTGMRKLLHEALYERVPGGARWRYVWGSTLVVAFVTQVITGLFLWMFYSPSTQTAWESVFYIQHELPGGWLLRGIHHYMAHAMVMLLGVHLLQVVIDGAYRAPRELNFVLGLVLMLIVLGLALTGYLLPWDQKGYWATKVGTELASQAPLAGPDLKDLAIGGSEYGHHTLTRFFALHAGLLPGLLVLMLVLHVALFRRHGLHAPDPQRAPDAMFWPDQLLKDSVAALAVLAGVLAWTIYSGGPDLTAPADPASPYAAARPETYFRFLFQFLKWFPGELEVWGAIVVPTLILAYMFLMPWIGRTRRGHVFNVATLAVLFGGLLLLTAQSLWDDYQADWTSRTEANAAEYDASAAFLAARRQAAHDAGRVIELAKSPTMIPPTGALTLVYDDPYLQGPKLFRQHCAGCHAHAGELPAVQVGIDPNEFRQDAYKWGINLVMIPSLAPSAPNLWEVGSRAWMQALLNAEKVADRDHFGFEGSPFVEGDMVTFVRETIGEDVPEEESTSVKDALLKVADALWLEAGTTTLVHPDALSELEERAREGRELMTGGLAEIVSNGMSCVDCHRFHDAGELGMAPDLTGYMSREWLMAFIRNPAAERFYGDKNDRMPAFAPHDNPQLNQLDDKSRGLIVDWLRGDWYRAGTDSGGQ